MGKRIMLGEDIYWVGKVDDRDVPFHRLTLTKGTTYNSYLLMTEKPTIIDTVDMSFGREFVENLKGIIELEKIKYIVINHTEPDHSGSLGGLAAKAKNAVIVCTKLAVDQLKEMYKLHNREIPKEEVMKAINEADAIFFGSSTRYGNMIGNMEDLLKSINTINLEGKIGATFGSYGWSGEAIEVVQDYLKKTNIKVLSTSDVIKSRGMIDIQLPIRIRFSPNDDNLKNIEKAVVYTTDLLLSTI